MNQIVLESAKGVKNGKVQLTFSQVINTGKQSNSILGLLNASDDRFNQSKPRYAWLSGEVTDINAQFGLDFSDLVEGQSVELGVVDPKLANIPTSLNIQITETTQGNSYDVANFDTRAKRAGKEGDFILHGGMYIYVRTSVVVGDAKHTLLTSDAPVVTSDVQNILG